MTKLEELKAALDAADAAYGDSYASYNNLFTPFIIIFQWCNPYHAAAKAAYAQRVTDTGIAAFDAYNAYKKELEKQDV